MAFSKQADHPSRHTEDDQSDGDQDDGHDLGRPLRHQQYARRRD
jgi:hypothetical protein